MTDVQKQDWYMCSEPRPTVRPRGHVICAVCGTHVILEASTCERLSEMWKAHRWARDNGTHTCDDCWGGEIVANAEHHARPERT